MKIVAYCWQSGQIEFGESVPEGALAIAHGGEKRLKEAVEGTARLARDNKTWLVPGIPEAKGSGARIKALFAYMDQVEKRLTRRAA